MALATQLDSLPPGDSVGQDNGWEEQSLPIESLGPPSKKVRLDITKDCSRDGIKWVRNFEGDGMIPFVKDADTGIVHAGSSEMEVEKVGSVSLVHCRSKPQCLDCDSQCKCFCHLLQAYYAERG